MLVTLSGMLICRSDVQPANALSPMLVTLSGMLICRSDVHPLNALRPMFVTLPGMVKSVCSERKEMSLVRSELYSTLPTTLKYGEWHVMVHLQPAKGFAFIVLILTELGIVISCNDVQPLNASFPMLVTLPGIWIFRSDVQALNASFPMLVTLSGMLICLSDVHPWIA